MATIFASGTYDIQDDVTWSNVNQQSVYVVCDTSVDSVTINLPQITQEFINVNFYISDKTNNATTNNIFIIPYSGDSINEGGAFAITTDGGSCIVTATSSTTTDNNAQPVVAKWLCVASAGGGGGGGVSSIQGGTDISVDSTNPASPIINYTGTGGSGITGTGVVSYIPRVATVSGSDILTLAQSSFYDNGSAVISGGYISDTSSIDFLTSTLDGSVQTHHASSSFGSNAGLTGNYAQAYTIFSTTRGSGIYTAESANDTYTFVKVGLFDGDNFGSNVEISAFKFALDNIFVNSPNINAGELATFVTAYDSQAGVNKTSLQSVARIIQITFTEYQTLVSTNAIVNGQAYWITDFNDAYAVFGCIFVGSPIPSQMLSIGLGGFANADYQGFGDYTNAATYSGVASTGYVGQWVLASQSSYALGNFVIYYDEMYQVIDATAFNSNAPNLNPTAYYYFSRLNYPTEGVGYIETWDSIVFNPTGNVVKYRYDAKRNNYINDNSLYNFQFGNDEVTNIATQTLDCSIAMDNQIGSIYDVTLTNSVNLNCVNNKGTISNALFINGAYTISLNSAILHTKCVYNNGISASIGRITFSPFNSYNGKEITNDYSTFDGTIDCSLLSPPTRIDLQTGYTPYLGQISLDKATILNSIDEIIHSGYLKNITFNFKDSVTSGSIEWLNGGNIYLNTRDAIGGTFVMDNTTGSNLSFAEFYLPSSNVSTLSNGVNF
jgi:hypothetical protein